MKKEIKDLLKIANPNELAWHKIIVSVFLGANSLSVKNNLLLKSLLIKSNPSINQAISKLSNAFSFEDLIEAFELLVPETDRVVNGAIYTPGYIKEFIVKNSFSGIKKAPGEILAVDLACGCGAFLYTIANEIHLATHKPFSKIYKENIFGLDICKSSVLRAEILLSLLAIKFGEDEKKFQFNIYCGNALSFDWFKSAKVVSENKGFDLVVGNPPYVRAKNIDAASRRLLPNWSVTASGNPDLYIPFFEIGLHFLNDHGVLGFITVNSFFRSVNARELRSFFQKNEVLLSIIDFGSERIFLGKSAYTCLFFASKKKSNFISYKKESKDTLLNNKMAGFDRISYKSLDSKTGWLLSDLRVIQNIKKIEGAGKALGSLFNIKNGIATLSNHIYIFKPISESKFFYELESNGKKFKIEKSICRNIIKPNILKTEDEIEHLMEKLIFPYEAKGSTLGLMNESFFKKNFPEAYKYLRANKTHLDSRDKGDGGYENWYAFGRTQALMDNGYKLLFPYMAKAPHFVFTDDRDLLIYCGYAIFSQSEQKLHILKKILQSKIFHYYIVNTSKPYSGDFFSYAKNYVKNFGVCCLSDQEEKFLLSTASTKKIDDFLIKKYCLDI